MGVLKKFFKYKEKDVQEYVIIKDVKFRNGDILKKGSNFIIDFVKDNKVCIHFPENTINKMNKYKEEFITIDKLFEIAMRYDNNQDLHEEIENLLEDNKMLIDRADDLENHIEEDKESDLYMEEMLSNTLEKTTEERNLYKEVINQMCDKYGIEHKEVFKIIDNIQENKNERER